MRRIKKMKKIGVALLLTLLLMLFLTGFVVADRNTRKIGFGDTTPLFSTYMEEDGRCGVSLYLMGQSHTLDFTPLYRAAQWIAQQTDNLLRGALER